jgi:hypothetical protein
MKERAHQGHGVINLQDLRCSLSVSVRPATGAAGVLCLDVAQKAAKA